MKISGRLVLLVAAASLALVAACSDDPAPAGEPRAEESSPAPSTPPDPTTPSPEPDPPPRITLTVVGDLMLVRGVPDAAAALAPLSERLRSADITVGNLESTLSTNGRADPGRRLVRWLTRSPRAAAPGRVRRAVAGQQPRR